MRRPGAADKVKESAEALAIQALTFLASDPEKLGTFLALSGIDPATLRALARHPDFLVGVLDHILSDDRLLIEFAAAAEVKPAHVGKARAALGGIWERDIP